MIVSCKERARATALIVMQVFDYRASNGPSIVRARTASDLVQNNQTAWCCMMEDVCRFHHFDHEGTLSGCQIVLRADTRKDTVNNADLGHFCWHITAKLGHQRDQGNLTQIG